MKTRLHFEITQFGGGNPHIKTMVEWCPKREKGNLKRGNGTPWVFKANILQANIHKSGMVEDQGGKWV